MAKAFIDAASYNLGLVGYLAGLPLQTVLFAGGIYNWIANFGGDHSGDIYGNTQPNHNSIIAGYNAGHLVGSQGTVPDNFILPLEGTDILLAPNGTSIHANEGTNSLTLGYYNASNQDLGGVQINSDGSEKDTALNMSGGDLISTTKSYDAANNYTGTTYNSTNGISFAYSSGTTSSSSYDTATNTITDDLITSSGTPLGVASINEATNTGTVLLADGTVIDLNAVPPQASIPDPTATPEQVLLGYLSDLGDTTSAGALDALNYAYLNPTGTAYTPTGTVVNVNNTSADVEFSPTTPGAVIHGQSTATITVNGSNETVPATNILNLTSGIYGTPANADIANDTITGVQELDLGSDVTLTASQFAGFGEITGAGQIIAANGGTFNLAASNVDQSANFYELEATDWSGTTLIGNARNNQLLVASLFGDDTLTAGNGTSDALVAGEGVDTLTGGGGGDIFQAYNGLAVGSTVTGTGTGNSLAAADDISGANISGIQTLRVHNGDITLNASEFGGFSTISDSITGTGVINAQSAGTYNLGLEDTTGDSFDMTALANGGTTLIGNNGSNEILTASATGNDTLTAGSGTGDELIAGGGVNHLTGSTAGGTTFMATNGLAAGSSVTGEGTGNTLETNGDISGDSISGISNLILTGGDSITLTASQLSSIGSITGPAGSELIAATGGTYNLPGTLDFDMTALSNAGTTLEEINASDVVLTASASGNDTLTSTGSNDELNASGSTGTDTLSAISGTNTSLNTTIYAGNGTDTIIGGASSTIYSGGGNDTIYGGGGMVLYEGSGNDTVYTNGGLDTIVGGTGNDTYVINLPTSPSLVTGTSITGGGGNDTLNIATGLAYDISVATITGVQTLVDNAAALTLNAAELDQFTSLSNPFGSLGFATLLASTAGTYSLATQTASGNFDLSALFTSANVTLIGNNQNDQVLIAGSGTDTLEAGSGTGDVLIGGTGITTFIVGGTGSAAQFSLATPGVTFVNGVEVIALGDPDTVEVQAGKSATVVGSDGTMTVNNDASGGVIQNTINWTAGGSEEQEFATTSGGSLSLENDQGYSGANGTGTQLWADSIVPQSNGSINTTLSGTGEVFAMSGVNVALANSTSVTLTGSNDSVGLGNNDTITFTTGANSDFAFCGNNNVVTFNGTNDSFVAYGNSNTINLTGTGDTAVDASPSTGGNSFSLTGNSEGASLAENGDTGTLSGNNDTATLYAGGESLTVAGTGDTVTDSGTGSNTISITGSHTTAYIANSNDVTTVGGTENTAYLFDNNTTLTLNGTYNTGVAYGSNDTINVNGVGDTGNDYGTSGDQVIVEGSGDNAIISKNGDSSTIAGSHNSAEIVATNDAISVSGNDNNVNDYVTTGGNSFSVTGSGNSVGTYNNDTITFSSPASSNFAAFGSGCTINDGGTGDSSVAYGNGNTVHLTGTGDSATDASPSTGSNSFILSGSSDTASLAESGDTATVTGSGNTVGANTGDTIILTSAASSNYDWMMSGETVSDAGTSDHTVLYASGDTVTVTGSGDLVTDAGTGGNTITLNGSSNTASINNTAGDTLTVGGSSNTITVNNAMTAAGTATINGTNDVLKFAAATSDAIVFGGSAIDELILSSAGSFAGTLAGMVSNDSVDLANYLFSSTPTVSSVTGTGATGTYTDVTIADGSAHVTLALLNQYTSQFGVSTSAYTLKADGTGGSAGTLFEIAPGH